MARYSDDRELNREIKYLYKIWSKVDSRIELPPSLAVKALLPLLDGVPAPKAKPESGVERPERRRIRFSPQVFNWKSGMTYAAALVLIVALASTMGRSGGELVGGPIELSPASPASEQAAVTETPVEAAPLPEREPTDAQAAPVPAKTHDKPETVPAATDSSEPAGTASDADEVELAVGGQSGSTLLGEYDGLTLTWRHNDATDPDKAGFPITVNAANNATGELVFELDVADLASVDSSYLFEGTLALLGPIDGHDGVALFCYDITGGEPVELDAFWQEGTLFDARLYKNVLNIFTRTDGSADPGCEIIDLPYATGGELCLVSAVDMSSMRMEQKAFRGADGALALSLYNLNAYLEYDGEATEDNEEGRYTAHIRLDGMSMELRAEQEP